MSSAERNPDPEGLDLFEHAPCGLLLLGADGRIVRVNSTFCSGLELDPVSLHGARFSDLLTAGGRIFYETHFAPLLRMQGAFDEVALDLRLPGGGRVPVMANAAETRDASGDLLFIRVAIIKAPERRQYERDLVEARREVERLNAALEARITEAEAGAELREQFVAVLGHDLRNPLAAIQAGTNLLALQPQTEKSTAVLALIRASVKRMGGLIDNILDLARARLGAGLTVSIKPRAALRPALEQILAEIRAAWPDQMVEAEFEDSLDGLNLDPDRIAQLFSNLLAKAVVHGAAGEPIRAGAAVSPGEFELWVSNAGEPISEAAMARLFQPFYRGDVRPHAGGLGLGLYIASEIARAHGGSLSVTSHATETRFTLRIPISTA